MLVCAAAAVLAVAPARLDAFVEKAVRAGLAPGLAIAVVEDGRMVHAAGFGDADREAGRRVRPAGRPRSRSTAAVCRGCAEARPAL